MNTIYLEWLGEDHQPQKLDVVDKVFIGRTCRGIEPHKRIILNNPLVSRDHAVISRSAHHLKITDNSINGTWINDVRMTAGSSKELKDGDIIRIAAANIQVVDPQYAAAGITDTWNTDMTVVSSTEIVVTNLVADIRQFSEFLQEQARRES